MAALRELVGLPERMTRRHIEALRTRGLVTGNGHQGFRLSETGWEHPAARPIRARLADELHQVAELERAGSRNHAEYAELQARALEADARREKAQNELLHEQTRREGLEYRRQHAEARARTADIVAGLKAEEILSLLANPSAGVYWQNLPRPKQRRLIAFVEEQERIRYVSESTWHPLRRAMAQRRGEVVEELVPARTGLTAVMAYAGEHAQRARVTAAPTQFQLPAATPEWMASGFEVVSAPVVMASYGPATYEPSRPLDKTSRPASSVGLMIGAIAFVGFALVVLLLVVGSQRD
jgi:hypothetical protein